ncbi:MAG: hypothetical protein ACC682_03970 [Gemmatimonadota bacterium]
MYRRRHTFVANQTGGALLIALLVSMVVVSMGALALNVARTEMRVAANHAQNVLARYHSESGLHQAVGLQNDLTQSPRYLFDAVSYSHRAIGPSDTSSFVLATADAPLAGGAQVEGDIEMWIVGKDPLNDPPPYLMRSRATMNDGSSATYEATIDVLSLLDFAVFSDDDIYIAPNITISGRVYSGANIGLTGATATFLQRVEYANQLFNSSYGVFQQGHTQVPSLPSIPALVDMAFYENASKDAGVCSSGRGLYLGTDGPGSVDSQTQNLFRAYRNGAPAGKSSTGTVSACRNSGTCYVIDLGQFDFTASPITYGGTPLIGYDGSGLDNFNGVIFSDGEVHVFGHLGGRSVEDRTVTDTLDYMTPPFVTTNLYSNSTLDAGEDGSGGGVSDGFLDTRNRGVNLGIYGSGTVWIDHNIWAGADSSGAPVRVALVAQDSVRIDRYSPRTIFSQAAVLAVDGTWRPDGTTNSHRNNDWARNGGDGGAGYAFDLDRDGAFESDNGAGNPGDSDETDMYTAWTLYNLGNLVVRQRPSSNPWTSSSPVHPRFYVYDTALVTAEIPCYPTLPDYGIVPGSFVDVVNTP